MKAHLHKEFKLWTFLVLCQSQSRMEGGKREESNMKFKRTEIVGHISSTSRSPFYSYYIFFESWEVMSPTLQTVCESELKWRSYGRLKTTAPSWAKNSQLQNQLTKILQGVSQLRNHLQAHVCHFTIQIPFSHHANQLVKSTFSCKMDTFSLRNPPV